MNSSIRGRRFIARSRSEAFFRRFFFHGLDLLLGLVDVSKVAWARRIIPETDDTLTHIITDVRPLSSLARYKISQHRVSQHRIGHELWLYRSNHQDLIALRTEQGMHTEASDLTGWAQVNGRNELPIS